MKRENKGSLREQVVRGTTWNGMASICELVMGLGTSILLMWLLTRRDFGLVAAATVFTGFAHLIEEGGIGSAIVQHKDESNLYASGVLANQVLVLVTSFLLALLAPWIAALCDEMLLASILCWLAIDAAVAGLGVVPRAMLARNMRFSTIAKISVAANFVASAVALWLAVKGAGFWSLVAQSVAKNATITSLSWLNAPRGVKGSTANWTVARSLFSYGIKAVSANVFGIMGNGGVRFVIQKTLGTEALGVYAAAWRLVATPLQAITGPMAGAAFPAFCRRQGSPETLARGFLHMVLMEIALIGPITVMIGVTAGHIIPIVAGPEWLPAISVSRIMAAQVLYECAFGLTYLLFLALGKPEYRAFFMLARTPVVILAALAGTRYGIEGAAIGKLLGHIVILPVLFYLFGKVSTISFAAYVQVLRTVTVPLGVLLAVSTMLLFLASELGMGHILSLALIGAGGAAVYLLFVHLICNSILIDLNTLFLQPMIRRLVPKK